jgi:hypothetical protein
MMISSFNKYYLDVPNMKAIILIILSASVAFANSDLSPEFLVTYSQSPQWKKLMYEERNRSRVQSSSNYFISSGSFQDPLTELKASIEAFLQPEDFFKKRGQHPSCIFPARFRILRRDLHLAIEPVPCPDLESWRAHFKAEEVVMIYASQYNSSPGSMMGHTLLKFKNRTQEDFLNWTFSYAANIPSDVGIFPYTYKGLTGGFPGVFSSQPYYQKIQEYNNMERRDIWEYPLKLTQEQREILTDHMWELNQLASFKYYFLDENCATLLLNALEVAAPEKPLTDSLRMYVIPAESVKVLDRQGLIDREIFRPSISRRVYHDYQTLSTPEQRRVRQALAGENIKDLQTPGEFDTVIDSLAMQRYMHEGQLSNEQADLEKMTMSQRAHLGVADPLLIEKPESPLKSHDTMHMAAGGGQASSNLNFARLSFRPGLHLMMDQDPGYISNSSFDVLSFELQSDAHKFYLRELTFFEIGIMNPSTDLDPQLSWNIKAFYSQNSNPLCENCHVFSVYPAFGRDWSLGRRTSLALLALVEAEAAKEFEKGYRVWPGGQIRLIYALSERFKFQQIESFEQEVVGLDQFQKWTHQSQLRIYGLRPHTDLGLEFLYEDHRHKLADFSEGLITMDYNF